MVNENSKGEIILKSRGNTAVENRQSNAEIILETSPEWRDCLRRSELDGIIWKCRVTPWNSPAGEEWTIHDLRELLSWLEREHNWSPPESLLYNAVEVVAHRQKFHPIKEFLMNLSWDEVPRLNSWLSRHLGAKDTAYTRAVGRKFMIAAVARVMIPGCKADYVLILEGPQGIGKSSALRALVPDASWFRDTPLDLNNKDAYLGLRGAWVIELAELESLSKAAVSRIKTFITSSVDSYRPPYQRAVVSVPRQCIFCGTTNDNDYLKDDTGGRRFWPARCGEDQINIADIKAVRDQLWAEAFHAFRAGETWYLGLNEERLAKIEQEERRPPDLLEDRVRALVDGEDSITLEYLLSQICGSKESSSSRGTVSKRVARILTHILGWTKGRVYRGGRRVHGYISPQSMAPEGVERKHGLAPQTEELLGEAGLAEPIDEVLDGDFDDQVNY